MADAPSPPFPRLPWDLREQIWQDAAYWQLGGRSGCIHYLKMDENRNLLPINYSRDIGDAGNESGLTWDSYVGPPGIMAACRHSYDVAKKFNQQCRRESISTERWSYCKRVFIPQAIGDCQIIDLRYDICCITSDSWESLLKPWKPIVLRTKDNRGRIRIEEIQNIAIKFEPAWNEELDKAYDERIYNGGGGPPRPVLRQFSPQLAFVIRVLFQLAPKGYHEGPRLMLIDDVSKYQSFGVEEHAGSRIFDGDQEYVELRPLLASGTHVPVKDSPMDEFVEELGYLYWGTWHRMSESNRLMHLLDSRFFTALLRRDNLVPGLSK